MCFAIRLAVVLALAASAGGSNLVLRGRYLPEGETLPGLRVDGAVPTGDLREFVAARAGALTARKVKLVTDGGSPLGEYTLAELGVRVDVDAVSDRARRMGHEGDLLGRAQAADDARTGRLDVPLAMTVDDAALVDIVAKYKESFDTAPTSARLDLEHRSVIPEKDGRYLDAFGAAAPLLATAKDASSNEVHVPVLSVPPRVTSDFVRSLDIHAVLGEFETYFSRSGDQA
ncbi:MAG TPA: peptidoglycan binding domain-containing protein, partial [Polyangiaceae bacterium]